MPAPAPLAPAVVAPAIATLARRGPDLIALRYGYAQADARLRASILSQFLPLSLGASGGRDTSGVYSAGPQVTLTLPLFNRNRGVIAVASASRAQLAAQYQARLAGAVGGAQALRRGVPCCKPRKMKPARPRPAPLPPPRRRAGLSRPVEITALAFAGLQSAAGDRARTAISLRGQVQTAEISLATLLGLGLPPLGPARSPPHRRHCSPPAPCCWPASSHFSRCGPAPSRRSDSPPPLPTLTPSSSCGAPCRCHLPGLRQHRRRACGGDHHARRAGDRHRGAGPARPGGGGGASPGAHRAGPAIGGGFAQGRE